MPLNPFYNPLYRLMVQSEVEGLMATGKSNRAWHIGIKKKILNVDFRISNIEGV
jgi:hypothetical protein